MQSTYLDNAKYPFENRADDKSLLLINTLCIKIIKANGFIMARKEVYCIPLISLLVATHTLIQKVLIR